MRRRGKDDGFHPHPGDPWHPGWSADEEPPAEPGAPTAEEAGEEPLAERTGAAAASGSADGESTVAGDGATAEATAAGVPTPLDEGVDAEPPPAAEEAADRAEEPGLVPPSAPRPGPDETAPQSLFDWAAGQTPASAPPVEPTVSEEPMEPGPGLSPLPPPWSPDEPELEAEGTVVRPEAEYGEEVVLGRTETPAGVEPTPSPPAAADARPSAPPPWSPEESEAAGEPMEPAPGAQETEPRPIVGDTQVLESVGDEAEIEDWLAFTTPPSAGEAGEPGRAEPPFGEEPARALAELPAPVAPRSLWPFGRRGRRRAEPAAESVREEEAAAPLPQPPPWSPDALPGEMEGSAESPPLPRVLQSELDRAAAIPVIPPVMPEEPPGEPLPPAPAEEAEWAAEAEIGEEAEAGEGTGPDEGAWWPEEAPRETAAPAWDEEGAEEGADEWEMLPGPGAEVEAPGGPVGEAALPGGPDTGTAVPADFMSEQILAGAVTSEHRDLAAAVAAADTSEAEMQAVSAPMAGLESGVVGFDDVVGLGGEAVEEEAPARSDLPLRVITGLVLVGLLVGALWVGGGLLAGFIGLLAFIGVVELYAALRRSGYRPLALFGTFGAAGLLAATWFYGLVAIPVAVVAVTVLCFFYYTLASRRRDPLTNGSLTLLGLLWVAGTLAFAFPIVTAPDYRVLVTALVATVVATDVGAYFAGRSWGTRPLAPVLSPHKTLEGLAGGVVLGVAAAVLIGHFFAPLSLRSGAALGLVVAVMAPLGDLVESMVKRSLGVKDMGSLLPGHGGVLDRVDAFLFVVPAVWVLYESLGLLR